MVTLIAHYASTVCKQSILTDLLLDFFNTRKDFFNTFEVVKKAWKNLNK